MPKRVLLLSGAPGVGKTTIILKTVDALKSNGISVGGMISREVRENNSRVGFEILDLANDKHDWLSHVNQKTGPQIGRYRVNLEGLENIGATAIKSALGKCDAVAIDEIGPMELFSQSFKQAVRQALDSKKLVLAVVHAEAKDSLISYAKQNNDAEIFAVTATNRGTLPEELKNKALAFLNSQQVT